jgi:signal transduction histidine kinase
MMSNDKTEGKLLSAADMVSDPAIKEPFIGQEKDLRLRIDELLEEKSRLRDEITRLRQGDEWLQREGAKMGNMAMTWPGPDISAGYAVQGDGEHNIEHQVRHAQKMEAVGTLAGGIAHDFNNILTAIIASASLMQRGLPADSPLRRHLDRIFSATERATALTQSILAYSRRQPSTPSPVKLNIILENLRKLLSRLVPENISFSVTLCDGDIPIMADIGQIEHVIMNLVANSIDAMPAGGELSIKAGKACTDGPGNLPNYVSPGNYAFLSVADTGAGMDAPTRKRLFEPFFTTKDVGKGTGLGLAMAYGIVKQHNGYIDVQSEPGSGATFAIYFPLHEDDRRGGGQSLDTLISAGGEAILLIEDDADVRNLLKEMLEGYGYQVIEAVDGTDGVEKFLIHQDHVALLLSDVMMPGKNGHEVFQEIRRIREEIRVIFISGYSAAATNEILGEGVDFLAKPVSPLELLTKIREALDK